MKSLLILSTIFIGYTSFAYERGNNIQVFAAIPVATAASGGPYKIDNKAYITLSAISSGVVTGTLQVQVSNDPQVGTKYPLAADWVNLTNGSISVATATGTAQITAQLPLTYSWLQVLWQPSAGNGTLTSNAQLSGY